MKITFLLPLSVLILCGCSVVAVNNRQTISNNTAGGMSRPEPMSSRSEDSNAQAGSNLSINGRSSCDRNTNYSFAQVESESRGQNTTTEMRVLDGNQVMASFELPFYDVKNLEVISTENTPGGFRLKVAWGGSLHRYEHTFEFACSENELVLQNVKTDQFSTTDAASGNYLDKKVTRNIKVDPNVPIGNFVLKDYLK
jgi:hypothetical protein